MNYHAFYDEFFSAFVSNHGSIQRDQTLCLESQKIFRKHFSVIIEELRTQCDVTSVEECFAPLRRADHMPISNFPTPEFLKFEREIRSLLESLDMVKSKPVARILYRCLLEFIERGVDTSRNIVKLIHSYPTPYKDFEFEYFLVHGTDSDDQKSKVLMILRALGLPSPIILERRAGGGSTLLFKFEQSARLANAAIVLITADDVGKRKDEKELKHRARQNVWFEAGFFRGVLPQNRVIFVKSADLEFPSDIGNLSHVDMKSPNWKRDFFLELVEAEFPVNHATAFAEL